MLTRYCFTSRPQTIRLPLRKLRCLTTLDTRELGSCHSVVMEARSIDRRVQTEAPLVAPQERRTQRGVPNGICTFALSTKTAKPLEYHTQVLTYTKRPKNGPLEGENHFSMTSSCENFFLRINGRFLSYISFKFLKFFTT